MRIRGSLMGATEAAGGGYKVPFQDDLVRITRSFNAGKAFTAASILPALADVKKFATEFRTKADKDRSPKLDAIRTRLGATPGTVRQQIRRDLDKAIAQLDYLSSHLKGKGAAPYLFKAGHKTFQDVKAALLEPYRLASQWSDVIQAANANAAQLGRDLVKGLLDVPSTIVGGAVNYVADQARKTLPQFSMPWWVPVAAVATVGAVVLGPTLAGMFARRKIR